MDATTTVTTGRTIAEFADAQTVGLTRFAYLLLGDRGLAEDLVQDAFVALYRRFGAARHLHHAGRRRHARPGVDRDARPVPVPPARAAGRRAAHRRAGHRGRRVPSS